MAFIIWIAFVVSCFLLNGFALKFLWGWFMVPTLGLPVISLAQSIGIALVIGYFTFKHIPKGKKDNGDVDIWQPIINEFSMSVAILAFGWIIHHWFM